MTLPHRDELLGIVRDVRVRWRWKVVLRSLVVLAAAGAATLLVAAYGLEQFRFSPASVVVARSVTYVMFASLGWVFFVRPLVRRVTDLQVALYLEEHEPSLDQLLVSAVDAGVSGRSPDKTGESLALLTRLVETAIARCRDIDLGRGLERQSLRRSLAALAAIAIVTAFVFGVGPAYLRQGAMAVIVPISGVEAASPYRIDVEPGHATVARGADVLIRARLHGFSSPDVDLFSRASKDAPFERVPMSVAPAGTPPANAGPGQAAGADAHGPGFETTFFGLRDSMDYFVQAAGVRSRVFRIEAADLPYVDRLQLEYVFPAYTAREPVVVEEGGDIAVLRGTTVRLRVHSTRPTAAGRVVRDGRDHVPLEAQADGTLVGSFPVSGDGLYSLELAAASGTYVAASPQYTIDALDDDPPVVSFSKPARDLRATSIDEVFVEVAADDDFGISRLDVVYAINGGPEKSVGLAGRGRRPLASITAGHTFFLEELGLQPGDVVSYFARAADNDTVQGAKSVTSDMFFLQIQPFRKDYRAAESQAGGQPAGGGQGAGNDPSALSEQQRRIVSGTFNLARDRDKAGADRFRQDVVFLALAQGQLKERANALAGQILERVATADPLMKTIAGHLQDASATMDTAEKKLQARDPKSALPPEQQALASLQRAEEAYRDVRVRMEQQRGGGGGGGGQSASGAADELADLFQLEVDKLRNQYETFQRSQQQSGDNKVDEMLERLKELARRQEQEAERQRQSGGARQQGGSATGARQRQLADDTEEAARQLERLSRDEGRQDLAQTARGLRQAAEAMRRAAASGDASAFAQAREAAERLGQARDRLDQQRSDRMARSIEDALSRVKRLARTQDEIATDVRALEAAGATRREQLQRIFERKDAQATEAADIERQLDRTASDFRRERQQASRKVQESADVIRDNKLKEKIRYSKGLAQNAPPADAAEFEAQIASDITAVEEQLRAAAGAVGEGERDGRAAALGLARGLVRGVESMGQRQQGGASGRDPRQFQRETRERRADAEGLRRDLQAMGIDPGELEALIGRLRSMESARAGGDPQESARLQTQLVEGFRRFEFDLRRRLGATAADQLFLAGSDDAPAGYRQAIEEYYRALARGRK